MLLAAVSGVLLDGADMAVTIGPGSVTALTVVARGSSGMNLPN